MAAHRGENQLTSSRSSSSPNTLTGSKAPLDSAELILAERSLARGSRARGVGSQMSEERGTALLPSALQLLRSVLTSCLRLSASSPRKRYVPARALSLPLPPSGPPLLFISCTVKHSTSTARTTTSLHTGRASYHALARLSDSARGARVLLVLRGGGEISLLVAPLKDGSGKLAADKNTLARARTLLAGRRARQTWPSDRRLPGRPRAV